MSDHDCTCGAWMSNGTAHRIGCPCFKVELREWSIVENVITATDPYRAPELRAPCLKGIVTGHPRKRDGEDVVTSPVTKAEGRLVETRHTRYVLVGPPAADYVAWCVENRIVFDPENPFKAKGKA